MKRRLTPRQTKTLEAITGFIGAYGFPPTIEQIGIAIDEPRGSAFTYVQALHRKGYLEVTGNGQLKVSAEGAS